VVEAWTVAMSIIALYLVLMIGLGYYATRVLKRLLPTSTF